MTTTEHVAAESRDDPEWFERWAEAAAARIATNAALAHALPDRPRPHPLTTHHNPRRTR